MGLLGGLEVRRGDAPLPVVGQKLKALLAMLALGTPHPVSDDRLIDEIWLDETPAHPANALQGQVSQLRRVLGRDTVARRGPGYVLAVGPDDVDSVRLERLVRAGRDAAAEGSAALASQRYNAALGLVRGPPLDDLVDFRFARDAAARLGELVLAAHEGRAEALLAVGGHAEVVAPLTGLVLAHPLRERFHALLILALYRCGRQADALRAFQGARHALVDELGVDPGPELVALERAVLAHDPALAGPSAPTHAGTASIDALPAPAAVVPGSHPFTGRADELQMLRDDLAVARAGHGRVALVGGEAGIGKTRLVEELADEAAIRGVTVLWGRCYEGQGAPPYWPWTQVLNRCLARLEPDVVRSVLGGDAAALIQIAPEIRDLVANLDRPPPLSPDAEQFRIYRVFAGILRRLAMLGPVVVVIDDLHWADPQSLGLIAFVADELADAAVLVVGTYRTADPPLGGQLLSTLAALSRRSRSRTLGLRGLDRASLATLVAAAGGHAGDDALDSLHWRTQGNPFFVTEILRLDSGHRDALSTADTSIPLSVKGVIGQRLDLLPPETSRTLAFAAALGQHFDLTVLAATIDVDGGTLLDHLQPALDIGILVDTPAGNSRYRFSHGLVNETIYDATGPAGRARTHQRIAEALQRIHGDADGPHLLSMAAALVGGGCRGGTGTGDRLRPQVRALGSIPCGTPAGRGPVGQRALDLLTALPDTAWRAGRRTAGTGRDLRAADPDPRLCRARSGTLLQEDPGAVRGGRRHLAVAAGAVAHRHHPQPPGSSLAPQLMPLVSSSNAPDLSRTLRCCLRATWHSAGCSFSEGTSPRHTPATTRPLRVALQATVER